MLSPAGRPAHAGRPRRVEPAAFGRAEPVHRDRHEPDLEAVALPRRLRSTRPTRRSPSPAASSRRRSASSAAAARSLRAAGGHRRHARHPRRPQHVPKRLPPFHGRPRGAGRKHDGRVRTALPAFAGTRSTTRPQARRASSSRAPTSPTTRGAGWEAPRWTPWETSPSASAPRPPASTRRSATRGGWPAIRRTRWRRARRRSSPAPAARPDTVSRWGDYSRHHGRPQRRLHVLVHERVLREHQLVQLEDPDRELQVPELRRRPARDACRQGHRRGNNNPVARSQGRHVVRQRHDRRERELLHRAPRRDVQRQLLGVRLRDARREQRPDHGRQHDHGERGTDPVAHL